MPAHLNLQNKNAGLVVRTFMLLCPLALINCAAPQPVVSDGTFATFDIEMRNSVGDSTLSTGPRPTRFSTGYDGTEIMSKVESSAPNSQTNQIPADQEVQFSYVELFLKPPLKCEFNFGMHPIAGHEYRLIVGDIPPTPRGTNPISEIGHILSAGDVPRCYVKRFERLANGTLKPDPFNDVTFEPSVVLPAWATMFKP